MKTIKTTITKNNDWWIAEFVIDEKEYGTQGKTLTELELMVKDAAGIMTGTPREEFLIVFENYP